MNPVYEKLVSCYECVRKKTDFVPKVAIILGSGLGDYASNIQVETEVPYGDIEGFPVSTVPGHAGKFIFGYIENVPVVCMKGRVHYYEGYPISDVVLPVRLMKMLGAVVILSAVLLLAVSKGRKRIIYAVFVTIFFGAEILLSLADVPVILKEINILSCFSFERFFMRYLNLNIFSVSVSRLPVFIVFINKINPFIGKPNLLTLSEYGILLDEKV